MPAARKQDDFKIKTLEAMAQGGQAAADAYSQGGQNAGSAEQQALAAQAADAAGINASPTSAGIEAAPIQGITGPAQDYMAQMGAATANWNAAAGDSMAGLAASAPDDVFEFQRRRALEEQAAAAAASGGGSSVSSADDAIPWAIDPQVYPEAYGGGLRYGGFQTSGEFTAAVEGKAQLDRERLEAKVGRAAGVAARNARQGAIDTRTELAAIQPALLTRAAILDARGDVADRRGEISWIDRMQQTAADPRLVDTAGYERKQADIQEAIDVLNASGAMTVGNQVDVLQGRLDATNEQLAWAEAINDSIYAGTRPEAALAGDRRAERFDARAEALRAQAEAAQVGASVIRPKLVGQAAANDVAAAMPIPEQYQLERQVATNDFAANPYETAGRFTPPTAAEQNYEIKAAWELDQRSQSVDGLLPSERNAVEDAAAIEMVGEQAYNEAQSLGMDPFAYMDIIGNPTFQAAEREAARLYMQEGYQPGDIEDYLTREWDQAGALSPEVMRIIMGRYSGLGVPSSLSPTYLDQYPNAGLPR